MHYDFYHVCSTVAHKMWKFAFNINCEIVTYLNKISSFRQKEITCILGDVAFWPETHADVYH